MKTMNVLLVAACALLLVQAVVSEECSAGDTKKDDCNSCFCSGGQWACTLMACPGTRVERDVESANRGSECRDGYRKHEECNDCVCKNGYWVCTRKACASHLSKRAVPECERGQTKQEECNRCSCANGHWACTRRFCPKLKRGKYRLSSLCFSLIFLWFC